LPSFHQSAVNVFFPLLIRFASLLVRQRAVPSRGRSPSPKFVVLFFSPLLPALTPPLLHAASKGNFFPDSFLTGRLDFSFPLFNGCSTALIPSGHKQAFFLTGRHSGFASFSVETKQHFLLEPDHRGACPFFPSRAGKRLFFPLPCADNAPVPSTMRTFLKSYVDCLLLSLLWESKSAVFFSFSGCLPPYPPFSPRALFPPPAAQHPGSICSFSLTLLLVLSPLRI